MRAIPALPASEPVQKKRMTLLREIALQEISSLFLNKDKVDSSDKAYKHQNQSH